MLIRHPDYDLSAADAVVGMNLCHHQGTMVTTTGATMVRHFILSERHGIYTLLMEGCSMRQHAC